MIQLLIFIFSFGNPKPPEAEVIIPYRDIEAIYLPADYSGPIVAIPSDEEIIFEQ